jgi:N-acetylmuramoyl-L-alanine amidase
MAQRFGPRSACVLVALTLVSAACTGGSSGRRVEAGKPSTPDSPPQLSGSPTASSPVLPPTPSPRPVVLRPPIVSKPIPFPDHRREQTAAYARRHYGLDTYRLQGPQAIVEHFTATESFASAWNTFASNAPDLGELPGTCAHFVVDSNGTMYQLVALDIMCRHASGMNWTAVGIEMVGFSDREILDRPRQMQAALSLTLWLMARFGIELRNVIGHNENLMSPLRRERVPSFRCQTHGDWSHPDMEIFRSKLGALAKRYGVPTGPAPNWIDPGC